jgi:hypothetical protein
MKIEDKGVITEFEVISSMGVLSEINLYLAVSRHSCGNWMAGGSSYDKNALIDSLRRFSSSEETYIYCVKVPVKNLVAL